MTVTTEGAASGSPAVRASGRGSPRAGTVEQLSRADRVAQGKDARAVAPLESHAEFAAGRVAGSGGAAAGAGESRGCRSSCRSGTGGCWCRRSRSTGGRRCRWRRTWPARPPPVCGCSCAGTRTCRISARSRRRSGGWSSTSTTSTRPCPGRSSGMSSGWRRAWRWPGRDNGFPAKARRKIVLAAAEGYRTAMRGFAGQPFLDVWYAHLDIEQAIGKFRSQMKAKRFKEDREAAGQGPHPGQHEGAGQAHHPGRGPAADHQRPPDDRPPGGPLHRRAGRRDLRGDPHGAGQVPAHPAV